MGDTISVFCIEFCLRLIKHGQKFHSSLGCILGEFSGSTADPRSHPDVDDIDFTAANSARIAITTTIRLGTYAAR